MKIGDEVKIISSHKQKFRKYIGRIGTVMHDMNKNEFGIEIKDEWNKSSKKGLFWFNENEIILENELLNMALKIKEHCTKQINNEGCSKCIFYYTHSFFTDCMFDKTIPNGWDLENND